MKSALKMQFLHFLIANLTSASPDFRLSNCMCSDLNVFGFSVSLDHFLSLPPSGSTKTAGLEFPFDCLLDV